MTSTYIGEMLKNNMMSGRPSRMKGFSDYTGMVVPPCGKFVQSTRSDEQQPWIPTSLSLQHLSLNDEISLFVEYMTPTREESALRADLVARFTALIKRLAPAATVTPFGSYITGLYFPTSDIDMVVSFGTLAYLNKAELARLEYQIKASGFSSKIQSVLQASTPLLRITDAKTGLDIDLTADNVNGHGKWSTEAVSSWVGQSDQSLIKSLVLVLKMFLSVRRLGTTFTGGINSYVLVWMVVAYVKLGLPTSQGSRGRDESIDDIVTGMTSLSMPSDNPDPAAGMSSGMSPSAASVDVGEALLGFLRFYGQDFDYARSSIRFSAGSVQLGRKSSQLFPISSSRRHIFTEPRYLLHIIDPADATINMGLKAYGIKHVRETFRSAYVEISAISGSTASRTTVMHGTTKSEGALGRFLGGNFSHFVSERRRIAGTWKGLS